MAKNRFCLFVAHGSRESHAKQGFDTLLDGLKKSLSPNPVAGAYLTLNEPSIASVIEGAMEKGFLDYLIVPLFFFEGTHLKNDIPQILADLKLKHQDLDFQIMPAIASIEGFSDWLVGQTAAKKK